MPGKPKSTRERRPERLPGLRVFVSYPRGGAAHAWAERVHAFLERLGADVWRDERSIAPGEADWYRRISDGLERADAVVAIVGADSEGCRWQEREMLQADRLGIPVVVLRIAPVALPLCMIERQSIDAGDASRRTADRRPAVQRTARRRAAIRWGNRDRRESQ